MRATASPCGLPTLNLFRKQVGDLGTGSCIPDQCGALRPPVLFPAPVALALVKN